MSLDIIYIRKCIIQIQNIQIENTFWDYPTFKGHNVKAIVRNEAKLKEGLEKDHDIKDHENLNIIKVIMAISVVDFQVGGYKINIFRDAILIARLEKWGEKKTFQQWILQFLSLKNVDLVKITHSRCNFCRIQT